MPHLVFIPRINRNTFLHLAVNGTAFCLRAYPNATAPKEVRRQGDGLFAEGVLNMAAEGGSRLISPPNVPRVPYSDAQFWHDHIAELNRQHLTSAPPPPPPPPPPGGDTADIKIDIRRGGVLVGVLRVSKVSVTWHPGGLSTGSRLSWSQFSELVRQHGEPVGL